jgi:TCP-1/cpn60 chaperonin family
MVAGAFAMAASEFDVAGKIRRARKVVQGVTRIADALKPALGPRGRAVTINMSDGSELETRNGVLIAEGVKFTDPWSDAAGSLLKRAGSYAELAGGGITNVALIAQSLLKDCAKAITTGIDGSELSRGIDMAAQAVMSELTAYAQPLKSGDQLAHVGTVAADGDDEIGHVVAQTIQLIESPGIITIVDKAGAKTELNYAAGQSIQFGEPFVRASSPWLKVATTRLMEPGQVAVIEIDGATPGDMEERRYRVESALRAVLAARADGVVAGGGSALLHAGKVLGKLTGANTAQDMGIDFVRRAISMPARQLVRNAGVDSSSVVRSLLRKDDVRVGYDVEKRGYADMYEAGVIDPLRATKNAVAGAASVASEFIGLPSTPGDFGSRHLRYFLPTDEFGGVASGVGSSGDKNYSGGIAAGDGQTPSEQAEAAQQPRRYLVGHFPDRVVLNTVETLTVEIAQIFSDGVAAAINDLQVPKEGLRIDIVIECPGFQLLTRDRHTIELPQAGNSDLAAFRLKAVPADQHGIRVSAFNGGTPIGGLNISVQVVATAQGGAGPGPVRTQNPTGDLKLDKGDVTLTIPATSDWMYWQDERSGPKEPVPPKKPLSELETFVKKKLLDIEDVVRKIYKATPALAEKALRDAGIELWRGMPSLR